MRLAIWPLFLTLLAAGIPGTKASTPKLVVLIVLDQFRAEYLTRNDRHFGKGGFRWLKEHGVTYEQAHYGHAATYTSPGHACLISGSYGHVNGIVANRWFNRQRKRTETIFFDPEAKPFGYDAVPLDDYTSPHNFIGSNLADQLLLSNQRRSKFIGVSNKDAASVAVSGKLGKAYWYHEAVGGMTTSSYYHSDIPKWIHDFNSRMIPDSFFNKTWTKLLPEREYEECWPDDMQYETDFKKMGKTFPHVLTDPSGKPGATFYEAFTATPWANSYQFEFARRALQAEQLGKDEYPDILAISLRATDIVGHQFGSESHELKDLIVRLDAQLAEFIAYLNNIYARDDWVIVLTADHGASPLPEFMASQGMHARRIKKKELKEGISKSLEERYGKATTEDPWVIELEEPSIFLNREKIHRMRLDIEEVENIAAEAALGVRGVGAAFTRHSLLRANGSEHFLVSRAMKSFHAARSGDLMVIPEPLSFWGKYGERETGTTHGSPYEYDTHVPLIFARSRFQQVKVIRKVDIADLAPTLAYLLKISASAASEGQILEEVVRP